MLRAAVALTLAVLVGCASEAPDVARDDGGRPTEAGEVRADRLRVGDCFDDQDDQSPDRFPVVPCGELHDNEAYFRFTVGGRDYPGADALTEQATARCRGAAFTDYVGRPVARSGYEVFFVLPSEETWERYDDRAVLCALFDEDLEQRRGSARASGG